MMKKLRIFLTVFIFTAYLAADEKAVEEVSEGPVKVKITEEPSELPLADTPKKPALKVEIELVEKLTESGKASVSSNEVMNIPLKNPDTLPVAVSEINPTNPDKNLVIYFILLMVIIVGIMLLASLIPGPRSREDKS